MTPLQIEMIIHFGCHVGPWPQKDAPACVEACEMFHRDGLIEYRIAHDEIRLTDRGWAYLNFLQAMPLPVANWAIPGPWSPSSPTKGPTP